MFSILCSLTASLNAIVRSILLVNSAMKPNFPLPIRIVNTTLPFRGRYRRAKGSKVRMINRRHLVRVKKKHTWKKKRHANEVSKEIKEIGKKPIEITLE